MSIENNGSLPRVPSLFPYEKHKEKEISLKEEKITEISKQIIPTEINRLPQELNGTKSNPASAHPVSQTTLPVQPDSTSVQIEQEFNEEKITKLREIFFFRYNEEKRWRWDPHYKADCGQFTHYLLTGKIGQFREIEEEMSIKKIELGKVDVEKIPHKPYTVYAVWAPRSPEGQQAMGGLYWAFQHYYMHLQEGYCISTNGLGPIQIFDSYEKMLMADAFPMRIGTLGRFTTEDGTPTNDMKQAVIGESEIGTIT